jgi:2-phospho-L-lactate guanylyltransferase (CobY/MobA/RfbA family)
LLYLAADLPYLEPREVAELLADLPAPRLVLGQGLRGGTNAILVPTRLPFRFLLGQDSFARHREQARMQHFEWRVVRAPGIEADIDLSEDLAELRRRYLDSWGHSVGTQPTALSGGAAAGGRLWPTG